MSDPVCSWVGTEESRSNIYADLGPLDKYEFVVDLDVRHPHGHCLVEARPHLLKELVDGARNQTPVLVVLRTAHHRERLASARLSVAHQGRVVAFDEGRNHRHRTVREHVLLTGVVQHLVELVLPALLLVVYQSLFHLLRNRDRDRLPASVRPPTVPLASISTFFDAKFDVGRVRTTTRICCLII